MKKHYLLLIVAIFICAAADAAERTWQQKRQIALSVLGKRVQTRAAQGGELKLLKEAKALSVLGYDGGGFAVISNDDRQEAVLGWSANKFDTDDMPDGLRWWLNAANEALSAKADYVRQYIPTEVDPSLPAAVQPMLKTVWGQSEPFNLLCPNKYPSGCVATAMAQIMYYHKYPTQSTGMIISNAGIINLSGITYDYASMLTDYRNGYYTTEQGNAVATLMRYAGAAVYMNYAAGGSGAYSIVAAVALRDNFSYNKNIAYRSRDYHTNADWMGMVYGELAASRPILYGAQDAYGSGGHAFVFDGYSVDGLVAVNWGWDGEGNGYYDIELLNPSMLGSSFQYSENQDMIMGIGLPDESIEHRSELVCNGNLEASYAAGMLTVNLSELAFYNFNIYEFNGEIQVKLVGDNSEQTLQTYSFANQPIPLFTRTSEGVGIYYNRINADYTAPLPPDLPDGTYTLYLAVQDGGYTEVTPISYAEGATSYYTLTKSGSSVTLVSGSGGTSSGIDGVTVQPDVAGKPADRRIYSIDGRYVGTDATQLPKGMYIRGGKKFVRR